MGLYKQQPWLVRAHLSLKRKVLLHLPSPFSPAPGTLLPPHTGFGNCVASGRARSLDRLTYLAVNCSFTCIFIYLWCWISTRSILCIDLPHGYLISRTIPREWGRREWLGEERGWGAGSPLCSLAGLSEMWNHNQKMKLTGSLMSCLLLSHAPVLSLHQPQQLQELHLTKTWHFLAVLVSAALAEMRFTAGQAGKSPPTLTGGSSQGRDMQPQQVDRIQMAWNTLERPLSYPEEIMSCSCGAGILESPSECVHSVPLPTSLSSSFSS